MNVTRTHVPLVVACLAAAAGCSKSHGISAEQRAKSDDLTATAVADMLAGNQDYTAIQGRLLEAVAANRENVSAKLFLGLVTVMKTASDEIQPGAPLDLMLQRAGYVQTGLPGALWTFGLQAENHGQGQFKDTIPTLGEIQSYVHGTVRPALAGLLTVLDSIPANWEYVIPAASGGLLLQYLAPGESIDLRLDYGDVQLLAALGHGLQTGFDLLRVINWDNLAPNDFDSVDHPNLDVLGVVVANYPNLGRLANPGDLLVARDRFKKTFQAYDRAAQHIRNENADQQAHGVITLGRDTFSNQLEEDVFLAVEARVRAFLGWVVDRCFTDTVSHIDTDPVTGETLPVSAQAEINFFRFFLLSLDLRDTYFKTIVNPLTGKHVLGVTSLAQLNATMATFGDVLVTLGGLAPSIGDLQELFYAMRVDAPPQSTKTIDGNFADWATGALRVQAPATSWLGYPAPELGSLFVAVDANYLYVYQDRNLLPYLTDLYDNFDILIMGPDGEASVHYTSGYGFSTSSTYGPLPEYATGPQGIEMRFPIPPGTTQFVQLEREVHAENSAYEFDTNPEPVFVKIR